MTDLRPQTVPSASMPPAGAVALRRLAFGSVLLCLTVIILGAWVRLTDAGLGCPDWPGCYGHVTPAGAEKNDGKIESFSPGWEYDSGKAWREMIHRYAATGLGLLIVLITAIAIAYRREKPMSVVYAVVLLATVVFQGMLGAFTVWWLVKPLVVVLHLAGGLTTLSLLFWLWLSMRRTTRIVQPVAGATRIDALDRARTAAIVATVVVGLQTLLGGWTSTNYAAVACPDLPTCQGRWWPQGMDYKDAFVLWRGLDINYTGGVLEHPHASRSTSRTAWARSSRPSPCCSRHGSRSAAHRRRWCATPDIGPWVPCRCNYGSPSP